MNCQRAQEKIIEALASRESEPPAELGQHLHGCAGCRAAFANQAALFQAIDSHLRVIANEPVPPSLLPGVRVRLREDARPCPKWVPNWRPAAVAALVVLAAAVSIPLRRWGTPGHATGTTPLVASSPASANRPRPSDRRVPAPAPAPAPARVAPKTRVRASSSPPEVLVLREEQEAFAHFVAGLSGGQDFAIALASSAPANGDAPVEIALLTIDSVEVKPLEGSGSE